MNPAGLAEQALLLEIQVSTVLARTSDSILVCLHNFAYSRPGDTWHDHKSASIQLELAFEKTGRAQ